MFQKEYIWLMPSSISTALLAVSPFTKWVYIYSAEHVITGILMPWQAVSVFLSFKCFIYNMVSKENISDFTISLFHRFFYLRLQWHFCIYRCLWWRICFTWMRLYTSAFIIQLTLVHPKMMRDANEKEKGGNEKQPKLQMQQNPIISCKYIA